MKFTDKRKIYDKMPLWLKQKICNIPFSLLAGQKYRNTYNRGTWFDKASRQDIRVFQEEKLHEILSFAVEEVPAYHGYKSLVSRFKPFEALKGFPLLDKETIQNDPSHFLPKSIKKIRHYETTTGGTSGNQLKIILDDSSQSVETAFIHRLWRSVGYSPNDKKATFRGVLFSALQQEVFWQENPIYNELQFSPFDMNDRNLLLYIEKLIEYQPKYIHGYPSSLDAISEFILRHSLQSSIPRISAALLGSEGATERQRERINSAFSTRTFSWYGHSERVILAGECECNSSYHHIPDYGVLEIIDEGSEACVCTGERGEIVGTGLWNYSMPLIRYKTGDYAKKLENYCKCGRCWDRFSEVEGHRKQEMIIGKTGAKISLAALNMHGPVFENVKRYQYVQEIIGHCVLKICPSPSFTKNDRNEIISAYKTKVGREVNFTIQLVDDIQLTQRGKLKLLISNI